VGYGTEHRHRVEEISDINKTLNEIEFVPDSRCTPLWK